MEPEMTPDEIARYIVQWIPILCLALFVVLLLFLSIMPR